jgi:hypothetical protein
MRVEFDATAIIRHTRSLRNMGERVEQELWTGLRKTALDMEKHIKSAMPVDTGRARASWGHWTPSDLRSGNRDANAGDAVHKEDRTDLEIIQGTNVDYVGRLNAGHSQQAPAGFIDMAVEMAKRQLTNIAKSIGLKVKP